MNHPEQIDQVWLAVDADGTVAAMITGGLAPLPAQAQDVEAALLALPPGGKATVHADAPRPDSFRALGARGLLVYDWRDVHRAAADAIGAYELAASPGARLRLSDLPADLGANAVQLDGSIRLGASRVWLTDDHRRQARTRATRRAVRIAFRMMLGVVAGALILEATFFFMSGLRDVDSLLRRVAVTLLVVPLAAFAFVFVLAVGEEKQNEAF